MTSMVSETFVLFVYVLFQWFYTVFLFYGILLFFIGFNNIWPQINTFIGFPLVLITFPITNHMFDCFSLF